MDDQVISFFLLLSDNRTEQSIFLMNRKKMLMAENAKRKMYSCNARCTGLRNFRNADFSERGLLDTHNHPLITWGLRRAVHDVVRIKSSPMIHNL